MKKRDTTAEAQALKKRFAGVSQKEFIKQHKLPISASMLSQNMSGNRPITFEVAIALAGAFGCTIAEISPWIASLVESARNLEIGTLPASAPEPDLAAGLHAVAKAFAAVAPAIRERVFDNLRMVALNPEEHAEDQIPIIVRKLSGEPDVLAA